MIACDLMFDCKVFININDKILTATKILSEQKILFAPLVDSEGKYLCTLSIFDLLEYSKGNKIEYFKNIEKHLKKNHVRINDNISYTNFESLDVLYVCDDSGILIGEINKDSFSEKYIESIKNDYNSIRKSLENEQFISKGILESMHDGIYLTDGNGYTLYINDAYTKISGINKERVIGKHATQLMSEGLYLDSASLQVIEQKKTVSMIDHFKDGKQNRIEGNQCILTANPVYDNKGNIVRVITNVRDLSELLELQEKLERIENLNLKYSVELEKFRKEQLKGPKIIAYSKSMLEILETVDRISNTDSVVLVSGETGVGKEVIVKEIHNKSFRKNAPFIKVNCGAIPENLFESELFGYEKGAFSGASSKGKPGMFELADGGTIFLDEIEALPLSVQPKLLRILQEGEIYRLGGITPKKINARVISATNKDLKELKKTGSFREDLFYRLNVVPIDIPPLRERKEDIEPLLMNFINEFNHKYIKNKSFSKKCIMMLQEYEWAGNIRELRNLVERIVVSYKENVIEADAISTILGGKRNEFCYSLHNENITLEEATFILEKAMLIESIEKYKTTRMASKSLGISQPSVVRKCKKYNIKL